MTNKMQSEPLQFSEEKKDDGEPAARESSKATKPTDSINSSEPASSSTAEDSAKGCADNRQMDGNKTKSLSDDTKPPLMLRLTWTLLRTLVIDFPLTVLFAALASAVLLHQVHDDYLYKQLELMRFAMDGRDYAETMYYHRYCNGEEVSAASVSEIVIPINATGEECAKHQMTHGVSMYQDLLTPETAHDLREFILEENKKQEGYYVIQNEFRYSWGIDVNMHPAIYKYWKELASNKVLVQGLQEIMGPDPAVIEFTAITSAYGAKDQHDHQDVVPPGSGAKFSQSFIPSYSLFIALQDTSYNMGATRVCPGSHLCSDGCDDNCHDGRNIAVSGDGDEDKWPTGWGALVNQQATHKGMGHTKEGGLDRVVIIATFAPRPQTFRALETRQIGQGGSYSLKWNLWGHTLSDFALAEERMWEPLKTMRSLGLVKGGGWTFPHQASMRITNDDNGYNSDGALDEFIEQGGFKFLPRAWQGEIEDDDDSSIDNSWYYFLIGTVKRTEKGLSDLYKMAVPLCLLTLLLVDLLRGFWTRRWSLPSTFLRGLLRLLLLHGVVASLAWWGMHTINESNWAKDITSGKSYRLPQLVSLVDEDGQHLTRATLPNELDVLRVPHYASRQLAGYGNVVDFAHPGNKKWNELTRGFAQGYLVLTGELQKDFCQSLIGYMRQDARFLKHGNEREWLPIEDSDELLDICHQDLVAASDKKTAAMVRELNSLKTTAKFGRFRTTAMQEDIIPRYLTAFWEPILVPQRPWSIRQGKANKPVNGVSISKRSILQAVPSSVVDHKRRYSIPKSREPEEPFPLAWIREGDVVEAMYECETDHYYRGTVLVILSNSATFDIEYADGDIDDGMERRCLRPFVPYHVGEMIQVRKNPEEFIDGTIWKIYQNEDDDDEDDEEDEEEDEDEDEDEEEFLFDVKLEGSNTVLGGIHPRDVRRFDNTALKKGARIAAKYKDGDKWFPGKIHRVNPDGSYWVRYMDGDNEKKVPRERIRT